ncbi:hypothetical protein B0I21_105225 [Sphingobacterium paludis]|uniref:Uncharacterized protein n=1 Tax=Sphingobacterium paludis TaxID=1476465 RepID=A0A4R7CYW6_9SPHI|nr:hypothetical protein B0I21_105225 [Sphingobacterium paludis]
MPEFRGYLKGLIQSGFGWLLVATFDQVRKIPNGYFVTTVTKHYLCNHAEK